MICTKDRIIKRTKRKEKSWTSNILNKISEHKFITTVVSLFISLSVLNAMLILNFMTLLEKNIYIQIK